MNNYFTICEKPTTTQQKFPSRKIFAYVNAPNRRGRVQALFSFRIVAMLEKPENKASDILDRASSLEIEQTIQAIERHKDRFVQVPLYTLDGGDKICIECGDIIPKARAQIDGVAFCIDCQTDSEKRIRKPF